MNMTIPLEVHTTYRVVLTDSGQQTGIWSDLEDAERAEAFHRGRGESAHVETRQVYHYETSWTAVNTDTESAAAQQGAALAATVDPVEQQGPCCGVESPSGAVCGLGEDHEGNHSVKVSGATKTWANESLAA